MNDVHLNNPPPLPEDPLGAIPDEQVPVRGPFAATEAILRHPRRLVFQLTQPRAGGLIASLLLLSISLALVYGFVIGTFSGGIQLWVAPLKVAGGLLASTLICLPSLYIFSCLAGARARLVDVAGVTVAMLALLTLLLIGFAPVAWVFSESTSSAAVMGGLHLLFWLVAVCFGWKFFLAGFRYLKAGPNGLLNVWVGIYILVCLQMTAALRPIIGKADTVFPTEKKFFISHWADSMGEARARPAGP